MKKIVVIVLCLFLLAIIISFGNIFMIKNIKVVFDKQPISVSESDIIEQSGIKFYTNIFNVQEKKVKKNIDDIYLDNSIDIIDIERNFPNGITIYATERKPIFVISYKNDINDIFIPTDKDFQLNEKVNIAETDDSLILIEGVFANNTFNTTEFIQLREIVYAFVELGFEEEGIKVFIKNIFVEEEKYEISLNCGNAKFILDRTKKESIYEQTIDCYNRFIELNQAEKIATNIYS